MIKFPFDPTKPVTGKASIQINKSIEEVFYFVGENFFDNYPKWALEVTEFEPLDGHKVFVGAKARQVRTDQGQEIQSTFEKLIRSAIEEGAENTVENIKNLVSDSEFESKTNL